MEEAGEDYYEKILFKGQRRLRSTSLEAKRKAALDQAPRVRGTVKRKLNGELVDQPIVTQIGFDEKLEDTRSYQAMSTSGRRRKLTPIAPIELEGYTQSDLGIKNPDPEISKAANTQRGAIRSKMKGTK